MIITLSQKKGGSGKSTVGTNVVVGLSCLGYSVGLLDTDTQKTSYDWFMDRVELQNDKTKIECQFVTGDIFDTIKAMEKRNDFLVIDTAGFKTDEMRRAVLASDLVIVPFRPKSYDLKVAVQTKSILDELRVVTDRFKVRALINSAPTNARDKRSDSAQEYLEAAGYELFSQRLFNRESYGDSGQEGLGVVEYNDQQSKTEIENLVREILHVRA